MLKICRRVQQMISVRHCHVTMTLQWTKRIQILFIYLLRIKFTDEINLKNVNL